MMTRKLIVAAFLGFIWSLSASAQDLQISHAWIRLLPEQLPAAGYFKLLNHSGHVFVLVGVSSPDYARAMMHQSMTMNGMEEMLPLKTIIIPAHGQISFAPDGDHLMLEGAKKTLKPGETVPITLHFSGGRELVTRFIVKGPAG
ncbi:MAG TPA: copper chaperone PCu(A)C [Burkholderiales bacterium]|nr:copper chaperone PCu(A)C [Burkholderiales bacterium]